MIAIRRSRTAWLTAAWMCAVVALLLALPLALFALFSYLKLGFINFSYYVPYEEFWQNLLSRDIGKIYSAPLIAMNLTSGFLVANMFTYTLGHTLVTVILGALVVSHVLLALRRARSCAMRIPAGSVGSATAGVFAATAASSSAALTGCCGAGMAGGLVALAGFGSAVGAWVSDAATWGQAVLVAALAITLLWRMRHEAAPRGRLGQTNGSA